MSSGVVPPGRDVNLVEGRPAASRLAFHMDLWSAPAKKAFQYEFFALLIALKYECFTVLTTLAELGEGRFL